jgi:hypothetical protein
VRFFIFGRPLLAGNVLLVGCYYWEGSCCRWEYCFLLEEALLLGRQLVRGLLLKALFVLGCSFIFGSSPVVGSLHVAEYFLVVGWPRCRQWLLGCQLAFVSLDTA